MDNMFINNKLNINIVTSGNNPINHSILQLTSWPVTPPPFGDRAFTTLIQPYKEVSKSLSNTDFNWALYDNPILREADTLYNAWISYTKYLKSLYCYPVKIKLNNLTNLEENVLFSFLHHMYYDFCDIINKRYSFEYPWPFDYKF